MKQKNLLTTMLLLFALIAGSMSAWADTSTLTPTSTAIAPSNDYFTVTYGGSGSNPAWQSKGVLRLYAKNSITFTSKNHELITGISFAATVNANKNGVYPTGISANVGTISPTSFSSAGDYSITWASTTGAEEVVLTIGGTAGNMEVASYTVTYESTASNPSAVLNKTELDFGKVDFGTTKDMTFTITPANLTSALTLTCNNNLYEVSPTSIASDVTAETTITVTAKPTALSDNMDATITISGGGLAANKTITLATTVTDPDANDGSSVAKAYTVAEANAATPASGTSDNVYIKGIVSAFHNTSIMGDGTSYRYYISDDGSTTGQLLVYKGKGLNNVAFSNANDLQLGDQIVIYGQLTMFSNAPEVAQNNYIVSLTRKELESITLSGTYTTTFVEGSVFNHEGVVVTANYDDQSTADITAQASFSAPDMTQIGDQTVTVTFKDMTASYTIHIIEKPYHTATFSVLGTETSDSFKEGTAITFPDVTAPAGYTFMGWTASEIADAQPTAPDDLTSSANMGDAALNFYAVFANSNGSGTATATLTANSSWQSYLDKTFTDDKGNTWSANCSGQNSSGTYYYGLRTTSGSYLESPTFPGNVITITINAKNGSSTDDRTFYIKSTKDGATGDLGSVEVTHGANGTDFDATLTGTSFNKFFVGVSAALSFHSIAVTYSTVAYADYCTSISEEIAISSVGWATFCSDKALDFTGITDLTAYTASKEGTAVKFNKVAGKVPANTGLLVSGVNTDIPVVESADAVDNLLVGVTEDTPMTAGIYVLMKESNGLGFYQTTQEFTVRANSAYLPSNIVGARTFIAIDEEATGIDAIETVNVENGKFYNLAGQRVAQPTKGLYIVNGKKYIVK